MIKKVLILENIDKVRTIVASRFIGRGSSCDYVLADMTQQADTVAKLDGLLAQNQYDLIVINYTRWNNFGSVNFIARFSNRKFPMLVICSGQEEVEKTEIFQNGALKTVILSPHTIVDSEKINEILTPVIAAIASQ